MTYFDATTPALIAAHMATTARPLDRALLAWRLDSDETQRERAIAALATYQNPDGGYGHGIEPDMWCAGSGPLSTSVGLQYAHALGLPSEHPAVMHALAYLAGQFDITTMQWRATAAGVNDAPHAPWWHRDADGLSGIDRMWENPTVELLGYFQHYASSMNPFLLDDLAERAAQYLAAQPDVMEQHGLACFVRWYRLAPPEWQARILPDLRRGIAATICTDPQLWQTAYVATPALVVESAADPWYDLVGAAAVLENAQLRETLRTTGCITPTWTWGQYPEQWEIARSHWTGKLTAEACIRIALFDQRDA